MLRYNFSPARVIEMGWLATAVLVPLAFDPWDNNAFELPKALLLRALALLLGLTALTQWTRASARPTKTPRLVLGLGLVFALAFAAATVLSVNVRVSIFGTYERQQGLLTRTDKRPLLALVGQAPVKVTTENGALQPGDLLVASSTPGYAMKAGPNPPVGAVIGKALEKLAAGTGIVKMLVMLR